MQRKKIAIAITGASGSIYARTLLQRLATLNDQVEKAGIVISESGRQVWTEELEESFPEKGPFPLYAHNDFRAPFASGSAGFDTMIVCPCSMGTLGRIAAGASADLITRAADVMLKERRNLILVVRESPFNLIHIRNMETVTLAGGIICPANPSFYSKPQTLEQLAATVVDRVLQLAGFQMDVYRWGE